MKKITKGLLVCSLVLALLVAFSACSDDEDSSSKTTLTTETTTAAPATEEIETTTTASTSETTEATTTTTEAEETDNTPEFCKVAMDEYVQLNSNAKHQLVEQITNYMKKQGTKIKLDLSTLVTKLDASGKNSSSDIVYTLVRKINQNY